MSSLLANWPFAREFNTFYQSFSESLNSNAAQKAFDELINSNWQADIIGLMESIVDPKSGKYLDEAQWSELIHFLIHVAQAQSSGQEEASEADRFTEYARIYDEVIGKPCLDNFMKRYLLDFSQASNINWGNAQILSVGCGTALVEEWMIKELGVSKKNLLGIDISDAMVQEASKRIHAEVQDFLKMDVTNRNDIIYSGLNVFQYLPPEKFDLAVEKASELLKQDGIFLGDFIAPNHLDWYPNVIISSDKKVISLRTPKIVNETGWRFQISQIINISFLSDLPSIHYSGFHKRFLPDIETVRQLFETNFRSGVSVRDAVSLESIKKGHDTCLSTRYVVSASK